MSTQKNAFQEMMAQYEANNAPKYDGVKKEYSLTNYFNTMLKDGVKSATKQIRILPGKDGSPFIEMHGHKAQIDGAFKTLPCLKHEKGEPCPMCETRELLMSTGSESDKELAKKLNARKMYVIKVIDRDNEQDGVKFWRFNHDYRQEGVYDKIFGVLNAIKKDITDADTGRDLVISINRNKSNIPIVSAIASIDPSPLSEDKTKQAEWLADERTWEDVYAIKNYEFMEIVVMGEVPVWNKDLSKFVAKSSLEGKAANDANKENNKESETTMTLDSLKDALKGGNKEIEVKEVETEEEEDDDLPF